MNKDELKGKAENLKGRAKDAAGSVSGDKEKQAEGFMDRARGAVREKFGEIKEEIERKREQQKQPEKPEEPEERDDE
jgi:uncharacterized protein YjbJ (UPF0337 family)